MPLSPGNSRAVISSNISEMVHAGYPQRQAVAASLSNARRHPRADGGSVAQALRVVGEAHDRHADGRRHLQFGGSGIPYYAREEARGEDSPISGFLGGDTLGRADAKNASVVSGSYVIPAETLAGLGMGNSLAGANLTQKWLTTGPFGTPLPRAGRGRGAPPPPHGLEAPEPPYAKGGGVPVNKGSKEPLACALSDGELVIPPEIVAHHSDLGALPLEDHDPKHYEAALRRGHDILDALIVELRKRHVAELKKLPAPAKD